MIVNDENNLHSTIKSVSSLMSSLSSKHFNALHQSMYYLNGFQTEEKEQRTKITVNTSMQSKFRCNERRAITRQSITTIRGNLGHYSTCIQILKILWHTLMDVKVIQNLSLLSKLINIHYLVFCAYIKFAIQELLKVYRRNECIEKLFSHIEVEA